MNCDPFHVFKCYIYSDHKYEADFHLDRLKRGMSNFPFLIFPKHSLTSPKEVKISLISLKIHHISYLLPKQKSTFLRNSYLFYKSYFPFKA